MTRIHDEALEAAALAFNEAENQRGIVTLGDQLSAAIAAYQKSTPLSPDERAADGGAAFPCGVMQDGYNTGQEPWQRGISMRDYFMAHAPAEPQPWFAPVMPERPGFPDPDQELSVEDAAEWRRLGEFAAEKGNERVKAFRQREAAAYEARGEWGNERKKQRYVQWPAAWADAMLRARAA